MAGTSRCDDCGAELAVESSGRPSSRQIGPYQLQRKAISLLSDTDPRREKFRKRIAEFESGGSQENESP